MRAFCGYMLCLMLFSGPVVAARPTVKLHPHIRSEPLKEKTFSLKSLKPWLEDSLIFSSKSQYMDAPVVVAEDRKYTLAGTNNILYVKGLCPIEDIRYKVYRGKKCYRHPKTKEYLGFEAEAVGVAQLELVGKISQFKVIKFNQDIELEDRLYPSSLSQLPSLLITKPGKATEEGYILSIRDDSTQAGAHQIVVLSLGEREGIEAGNLLDIYQNRVDSPNTMNEEKAGPVRFPPNKVGQVLVFRTFEKLSLAFILKASDEINLLDKVRNP
jgi:hypothetical protein